MSGLEGFESKMRLRLVLGKYRVSKVEKTALDVTFVLDLGNGVKMSLNTPAYADVREGDLLTLFTEVLANANA